VGGAHALQAVHALPPIVQKHYFAMLLEALSCPLPISTTRIFGGGLVCR